MKIVIPEERPRHQMMLPDGATLTLSPILKTDREFFQKGLEEMSIASRFSRFGQGVSSLSERELDYLTDVDQRTHVAWGAAVGDEVAGVSRYITGGRDGCPECAVTVLDHMQGRRIGSALFMALVAVARADGVEELCFEASADNLAIRSLMSEVEIRPITSDGLLERRIRLSDIEPDPEEPALVDVIEGVRG